MTDSGTASPDVDAGVRGKGEDLRKHARRHTTLGLVMAATAAVGIAFWAGRATAPETEAAPFSTCPEALKAGTDLESQFGTQQAAGQNDAAMVTARTYATLIVQNPSCFSPAGRASAQQFLTQHALDQNSQDINGLREAQCAAAGKGWWC